MNITVVSRKSRLHRMPLESALGNGDGTFQTQTTYAVGNAPDAIAVGDFNGDGQLDLAVANYNDKHGVGAAGQRRRHLPGPEDLRRRHRLRCRIDRGRLQRRRTNSTSPSPTSPDNTVSVLLGNGDGTFQNPTSDAVGNDPDAIAVGDFNGDGQLDLAVANDEDNTVSVLLGNGDGTFQTRRTYAVGGGPDAVAVGDFNGDGRLDLAVANARFSTVPPAYATEHGVGAAGQRRRHLPDPADLRRRR